MPPSFRSLLPALAVVWVLLVAGSVLTLIVALSTEGHGRLVITALWLPVQAAAGCALIEGALAFIQPLHGNLGCGRSVLRTGA